MVENKDKYLEYLVHKKGLQKGSAYSYGRYLEAVSSRLNMDIGASTIKNKIDVDSLIGKFVETDAAQRYQNNWKTALRAYYNFLEEDVSHSDERARANGDDLIKQKEGSNYMAWVAQRAGHDDFAKGIHKVWDKKCALTGLYAPRLLQACHLVPWEEADKDEKTNPHNGLLLCAHLHALLDEHLISFDSKGNLLIDSSLDQGVIKLVLSSGMTTLRKKPTQEQIAFLARHRQAAVNKKRKLILAV